ncbi:MAG: RHS repeat-associated core domain-containing protein, partial [bacterium]|nr:RHS repeat-associated core domain-containing protein [bacterium]
WTLRDSGGLLLREYESDEEGNVYPVRDEIYRGSSLLATVSQDVSGVFGEVAHYSLDHLGTPRLITTDTGEVKSLHKYYPFGEEATLANQDRHPMKFTGHERDFFASGESDDLDYMHARYCSPHLSRFMSLDPVLGDPAVPQSWNRYSYVRNNPMNAVDPTGEAIYLKTHEVAAGRYHAAVVIVPEDQQAFKGDERFEVTEEEGVLATLGAGPIDGLLVGEKNRDSDIELDTAKDFIRIDLGGRNENEVIESLFAADSLYDDSLDYDLFPAQTGQGSALLPARAQDGYNSNSYARGLLESVGMKVPRPTVRVPGFQKPVPPEHFRGNR